MKHVIPKHDVPALKAPPEGGGFLLVSEDLLGNVVDDHGTFKVGYGWISAVFLPKGLISTKSFSRVRY